VLLGFRGAKFITKFITIFIVLISLFVVVVIYFPVLYTFNSSFINIIKNLMLKIAQDVFTIVEVSCFNDLNSALILGRMLFRPEKLKNYRLFCIKNSI
jgi:hypothetical protein